MNGPVGIVLRGTLGAIVGGVLGYFVFTWLASQGFYALAVPGALLGLGCAVLMQKNSNLAGILCGLAAVPLSILCEWRAFPFIADRSLGFFVTHLQDLRSMTWIMLILGAAFAYWLGKGRDVYNTRSIRATRPG